MNKPTLESEIRDHYESQFLGEDAMEVLVLSQANASLKRRNQTLRWTAVLAVAALLVVALGVFVPGATESSVVLDDAVGADDVPEIATTRAASVADEIDAGPSVPVPKVGPTIPSKTPSETPLDSPGPKTPTPKSTPTPKTIPANPYRLVAFRSHGDGCPFCRATGQVYDDLAAKLDDQDLAIEQFDLSKAADRDSIRHRLDQLQLTSLIEGRMETAFLTLIDREGRPIGEFKPSMSSEVIAQSVRDLISKTR